MDELIRAIADAPDDDAPRLVWADREGGDRGELVVLQCAIAARQGARAERVRMQARVRDLLERIAGSYEVYRRGFCDEVGLELDDVIPFVFEQHPLARRLKVLAFNHYVPALEGPTPEEAWADAERELAAALARIPSGRLRGIELNAAVEEKGDYQYPDEDHGFGDQLLGFFARTLPSLDEVIAIGGGLTPACAPAVARLGLRSLMGSWAVPGVAPVPHFGPWNSGVNGDALLRLLPDVRDVVELDLWANALGEADLLAIARSPFTRLDNLGAGWARWTRDAAEAIAALPITRLCAYTWKDEAGPPLVPLVTPALRYLRLGRLHPGDLEVLVGSQLEELEVDQLDAHDLATLRAHIPLVNDG